MKISTSLVRVFFVSLLLVMAFTASGRDLVSITALPQATVEPQSREGTVAITETYLGDAVVAPNAGCTEVEPNENAAEATPISVPGSCTGAAASIDPGDYVVTYSGGASDDVEDVWKIVLGSSGALTVTATFNTSGDLDIFLFTVSGSSITPLANSSKENTTSETFTTTRPAGTYYIGVSAYTGTSPYTLDVTGPGGGTVTVNAPSNLQAQATSSSVIRLTWNDNSTNEDEFRVEQKAGSSFVDIGAASANATAINVTGFLAGETGTFRIRARAGATYSTYSNEASATTTGSSLPCTPDARTVCLLNQRFKVKIDYVNPFSNPPNQPGTFLATRLNSAAGINPDVALFGFDNAQAIEVVVRLVDTRPFAPRFDIYIGGLTDVQYTVTITDTQTGRVFTHTNAVGQVGGRVDRTYFPAN